MTAPTPRGVTAPTAALSAGEAIAKRIAARAVQSLADSLPDEDTIEAQDRLKGTPQESMFVVSAEALEELIAVAISNAVYDGELGAPAALLAATPEERKRITDTDVTAWLIEVPQSGGAVWWTGQEDMDGNLPESSRLAWLKVFSSDVDKAVRFRSEADAHAVLRLLPQCWKLWTYPAVITEHQWCSGPDLAAATPEVA